MGVSELVLEYHTSLLIRNHTHDGHRWMDERTKPRKTTFFDKEALVGIR